MDEKKVDVGDDEKWNREGTVAGLTGTYKSANVKEGARFTVRPPAFRAFQMYENFIRRSPC